LIYLTNWNYVLQVALKKKILKNDEVLIIKNFLKSVGVKS